MSPKIRIAQNNKINNDLQNQLNTILIKTKKELLSVTNKNSSDILNKKLNKQSKPTIHRKQNPYTQEAAYAMNTQEVYNSYQRPFEARLPTFNETAEITKEKKKLMDKYYVNKNIFI